MIHYKAEELVLEKRSKFFINTQRKKERLYRRDYLMTREVDTGKLCLMSDPLKLCKLWEKAEWYSSSKCPNFFTDLFIQY